MPTSDNYSAYSPEAQAKNVLTLLDQLNVESIVLGGYDIGSRVAQMIAHMAPERVHSLVLSAPVYPGFGTRPLEPEAQQERWYQHFHLLPQADQLIGHDQETVRLYLSHFYNHWVGNKQALRPRSLKRSSRRMPNQKRHEEVLPGIEQEVVPGKLLYIGHFVPFEAPEAVVEAIRTVL
jgi:pimeloyl-ACP methyl ester carboxylesterase